MALFTIESVDSEMIHDFTIDYGDLYEVAELNILQLEASPDNSELLNALFRAVHTVKGNCGLLGITPIAELLQELESILDLVRRRELPFQVLIGDLTLLLLDRCTAFFNTLDTYNSVEYDANLFSRISAQLGRAIEADPASRTKALVKTLSLLDPNTVAVPEPSNNDELLARYSIEPSDDLLFIMQLSEQTQSRAAFWQGRIERVLSWLIMLNEYAGQPVQPEQLLVAVCMHDIGMAMLPSALINKESALTAEEKQSVQDHVWVASRLISSFPTWHIARKIIDHHQENFDGSGYPLGIKGDEICVGGQMLAVVHAFEAITHGYSKSLSRKRPLMRAVMELNRFSGIQFNPKWVTAFMEVTRATN